MTSPNAEYVMRAIKQVLKDHAVRSPDSLDAIAKDIADALAHIGSSGNAVKGFLAACAIGAMLTLVPLTYLSVTPASATSPTGCKTDRYVDDIFCYQILGPKGTNFVDVFQGTVHDIKGTPLSVLMHVYGPTTFGASVNFYNQVDQVYVRVPAYATEHYFMPVFRHLLQGEYCARESTHTHTSAAICWWVFVQP